MANTHSTLTSLFTDIASAIREKGGTTASIVADTFPTAIRSIPTLNISDTTASGADVLSGKVFYTSSGNRTTGAISNLTFPTSLNTISTWSRIATISAPLGGEQYLNIPSGYASTSAGYMVGRDLGFELAKGGSSSYQQQAVDHYGASYLFTGIRSGGFACTSITSCSFPYVMTIGAYAFMDCSKLVTANFPKFSGSIRSCTFSGCYSLQTVTFSSIKYIGASAFFSCGLASIDLSYVSQIDSYAFAGCKKISSIYAPQCSSIGASAFYNCSSMTEITFSSIAYIGRSAFTYCKFLSRINTSNYIVTVGDLYEGTFYACKSLPYLTIVFSKSTTAIIHGWQFYNNSSLSYVIFKADNGLSFSSNRQFIYCNSLNSLYLITPSVVGQYTTLYDSGDDITANNIYVPASLYSAYISDSKWSRFSSKFVSLTDAEIEALGV